ncbi:adenylate/guanylate cyclase domain-containing protein [Enterocloster bolteae]|uniref:CHASE2 domain-containing protein n=1 Tax=Enterocloster bolteae TaxID=208479 RepID=UPI002A841726|nr:adenylate/guanylate cyclase domain-containing protein [Enterocloster bolteae]
MDKKLIKAYLPWGLCAGIFTIAAASGLFYEMDNRLSDALYQERRGTDARIAIVGIDQRSLEELGPFVTWDRRILAQTVSYLNQGDIRPAVIGLDVLLAGETGTEGDLLLAEAAGTGENVVTAAAGTFGSSLVTAEDGTFYLDDFTVKSFDEPYKALRDVTAQGHINAMYDKDGILRHQLLELGLPDGRVFPSFALTIARKYIQQEEGREAGLPPADSRGFWYLNYSGLPEDYSDFISIVDLLEENIPPEYFADRIVLIGPYAAGLGDQYITSADRGEPMYGVEIQANAIHALLEGDYKEEPGAGIQLAVLFLVLAAAGAWFKSSGLAGGGAVWLAGSFAYVIIAKAAYEKGMVLHILWIPLGLTLFFGASVVIHYGKAVLEKQRVTATFKRYAAPEIVDEILRQGTQSLELGGKLTQLAVLFVDIRGFTSMSEALEPGQVVEVLNSYLTLVSSSIKNHGGTLDKFIGDAAMAFWGAPLAQEDYVMKAVLAALDMAKEADRLGDQLEARFGRRLTFGTGIHTGPAVVGNVGAPDRMDYTAIGDTVNTASRLESNAPGGKIYISAAVANALEGRINAKAIGSIRLKGKAGEFQVLELEGLAEGSSGRMPVSEGKKAD